MAQEKNLATIDTESFKLDTEKPQENRVILNIQEENEGIILDKGPGDDLVGRGLIFRVYHKINNFFLENSSVKLKEKATFFHLLGVMINAGIPMIKSLKSLESQSEKSPRLKIVIKQLKDDIESGTSLSAAMLPFEKIFTEAEVGMVESGEASGQLSKVLENIGKDVEKAHTIKSKVKSAMMYPVVIFCLLIAVVAVMMVYVVPKLTELFNSVQGELPLITKIVVGLSDFLRANGLFIIASILGVVLGLVLFKKTDTGRYAFDKFKISIPIFGKLFKMSYLSRFARSLSNLLDSNVSIVKTLEITANSIGNEVYRKRLMLSVEDIKQGIPLAENLTSSDLFPPMLVNMIDVGEKTAQLDEITAKVASFYEEEVDTAVAGISKVIEPVMLIFIGLTVGTVVAAIMLPIMKLSNLSSAL